MKNYWKSSEAAKCAGDLLQLRVYSSRLLGQESDLVLHGGGNTSAKIKQRDIFGMEEDILYIKGSGWDLATIEAAGFAPVKLKALLQLAALPHLTDAEMVKQQRMALTDPAAPNPSVEAILHAIIPYTFVDHTHADAVVTISNSAGGKEIIEQLFGETMLIVPYVMPGFLLAKEIYRLTRNLDWSKTEGIILLHHGVFTFADDARRSYEKMIAIVSKAEHYLSKRITEKLRASGKGKPPPLRIARIRQRICQTWGKPILAHLDNSPFCRAFSNLPKLREITSRGPLTPDHIIRTKRTALVLGDDYAADIDHYAEAYIDYFNTFNSGTLQPLDAAARWAVWPDNGTLSFGRTIKDCAIVADISRHTMKAIYQAGQLGGWQTLSKKDLFEMEYWELEQAKLDKNKVSKPLQGKIALVTGAASGIGKACVQELVQQGAVVAALDINPALHKRFDDPAVLTLCCDITDSKELNKALNSSIAHFGGLDMLICNAGIFPRSYLLAEMDEATWNKSMAVNLTSHQQLLKICLPYLELGMEPAVVIIGSKNVAAPGPGAAAYSVAKAGLTQLARIAALEFGTKGIRVNILHPNAVFDTAIWTDEILAARAAHYGLIVQKYKTNNILKVEITSQDAAQMAVIMLGPAFAKITGAQIPIDGGNERTI